LSVETGSSAAKGGSDFAVAGIFYLFYTGGAHVACNGTRFTLGTANLIGVLASGACLALVVGRKTKFFGILAQRTTTTALGIGRTTKKIGKLTRGTFGALTV